jgi:polysaccharide biosynthesis transport protein
LLVLGLATTMGLIFGGIAGFWRDFADRVFRTAGQLETALQTQCIALVPLVKEPTEKGEITDLGREVKSVGEKREIQLVKDVKLRDAGRQIIARVPGFYSTIVEAPFSAFTESIRSIKLAADLSPSATGGKIIGFTSSVPAEGKSSMARAMARLTAHTGARTLLIDADLRNPSLTRLLSPKAACGLLEVIRGQATLGKAIWVDQATNMSFLPGVVKSRMAHSSEILASPQMRKFVNGLRDSYDYIIVDFSPLMPIVDVRASTDLVDAYVFVVEWGKTRIDFVEQALRSSRGVYEHLLGVVLNKVNLRSMGRYDGRGGSYYYHGSYSRYGYTE